MAEIDKGLPNIKPEDEILEQETLEEVDIADQLGKKPIEVTEEDDGGATIDFDPNQDLSISFQSGYSYSKTQQVTGTSRYLADGFTYTYYQLRGKYKNWFSQMYINQGNSGETRGYDLGNMIDD